MRKKRRERAWRIYCFREKPSLEGKKVPKVTTRRKRCENTARKTSGTKITTEVNTTARNSTGYNMPRHPPVFITCQ